MLSTKEEELLRLYEGLGGDVRRGTMLFDIML